MSASSVTSSVPSTPISSNGGILQANIPSDFAQQLDAIGASFLIDPTIEETKDAFLIAEDFHQRFIAAYGDPTA